MRDSMEERLRTSEKERGNVERKVMELESALMEQVGEVERLRMELDSQRKVCQRGGGSCLPDLHASLYSMFVRVFRYNGDMCSGDVCSGDMLCAQVCRGDV